MRVPGSPGRMNVMQKTSDNWKIPVVIRHHAGYFITRAAGGIASALICLAMCRISYTAGAAMLNVVTAYWLYVLCSGAAWKIEFDGTFLTKKTIFHQTSINIHGEDCEVILDCENGYTDKFPILMIFDGDHIAMTVTTESMRQIKPLLQRITSAGIAITSE